MREIKFRAYDYDNKRFEYDVQYNYDYELGSSFLDILEDNHFAVEQYTGIKDINGVEIYEGDLILAKSIEYEVEWFNTSFWVIPYSGVGSSQPISNLYEYDGKNIKNIRVIGNTHEDE